MLKGEILDVTVCVNPRSKYYGRISHKALSSECPHSLLISEDDAHGFLVIGKEDAIVAYHVYNDFVPTHDLGCAWDSIDFDWPITSPILSERDRKHPIFGKHNW